MTDIERSFYQGEASPQQGGSEIGDMEIINRMIATNAIDKRTLTDRAAGPYELDLDPSTIENGDHLTFVVNNNVISLAATALPATLPPTPGSVVAESFADDLVFDTKHIPPYSFNDLTDVPMLPTVFGTQTEHTVPVAGPMNASWSLLDEQNFKDTADLTSFVSNLPYTRLTGAPTTLPPTAGTVVAGSFDADLVFALKHIPQIPWATGVSGKPTIPTVPSTLPPTAGSVEVDSLADDFLLPLNKLAALTAAVMPTGTLIYTGTPTAQKIPVHDGSEWILEDKPTGGGGSTFTVGGTKAQHTVPVAPNATGDPSWSLLDEDNLKATTQIPQSYLEDLVNADLPDNIGLGKIAPPANSSGSAPLLTNADGDGVVVGSFPAAPTLVGLVGGTPSATNNAIVYNPSTSSYGPGPIPAPVLSADDIPQIPGGKVISGTLPLTAWSLLGITAAGQTPTSRSINGQFSVVWAAGDSGGDDNNGGDEPEPEVIMNKFVRGKELTGSNSTGSVGWLHQAGTAGVKITADASNPLVVLVDSNEYQLTESRTGGAPLPTIAAVGSLTFNPVVWSSGSTIPTVDGWLYGGSSAANANISSYNNFGQLAFPRTTRTGSSTDLIRRSHGGTTGYLSSLFGEESSNFINFAPTGYGKSTVPTTIDTTVGSTIATYLAYSGVFTDPLNDWDIKISPNTGFTAGRLPNPDQYPENAFFFRSADKRWWRRTSSGVWEKTSYVMLGVCVIDGNSVVGVRGFRNQVFLEDLGDADHSAEVVASITTIAPSSQFVGGQGFDTSSQPDGIISLAADGTAEANTTFYAYYDPADGDYFYDKEPPVRLVLPGSGTNDVHPYKHGIYLNTFTTNADAGLGDIDDPYTTSYSPWQTNAIGTTWTSAWQDDIEFRYSGASTITPRVDIGFESSPARGSFWLFYEYEGTDGTGVPFYTRYLQRTSNGNGWSIDHAYASGETEDIADLTQSSGAIENIIVLPAGRPPRMRVRAKQRGSGGNNPPRWRVSISSRTLP